MRLVTYQIETRGKVRGALDSFRERTAEIYADPRGWSRANVHFKRVQSGGAFSLVLSQAKYVPTFAPICDRYWSCRVGRYVIINEDRWRRGTPVLQERPAARCASTAPWSSTTRPVTGSASVTRPAAGRGSRPR